jgi:hypothetical protein
MFIDRKLSGISGVMSARRGQLIPARRMESKPSLLDVGLYRYQVCLDLPKGALNVTWLEHLTSSGIALGCCTGCVCLSPYRLTSVNE